MPYDRKKLPIGVIHRRISSRTVKTGSLESVAACRGWPVALAIVEFSDCGPAGAVYANRRRCKPARASCAAVRGPEPSIYQISPMLYKRCLSAARLAFRAERAR